MGRLKFAQVAVAFVLAAACTGKTSDARTSTGRIADEGHRSLWKSANINDYSWSVFVDCLTCGDFPGGFDVTVVDGEPVDLRGTDFRGEVQKLSIAKDEKDGLVPLTVEELFDRLDAAYASNAEVINVDYDEALGYPRHVAIDPSRTTSDDEIEFTVKSFQPTSAG